jgi:uncharacterized membrane protein YozB (DUF420 family)
MNNISYVRAMDKRLRVMLIATALLILPQIGQFISWGDAARGGGDGDLAIFFKFAAIFIVPTSLILSAAIVMGVRRTWRRHRAIMLLGTINALIALNIVWYLARG